MWIALQRAGEEVGRGRVARLMREAGIQGAKRRGRPWRTTTPDPAARRRPDLVQRDFSAAGPDRLWVGDFTYLRSWEASCQPTPLREKASITKAKNEAPSQERR
jgi:putative transposase